MSGTELTRRLPGTTQQVWRALTDADALTQWFWPEQSFGTTARTDPRVGGEYRITGPLAGIAVSGRYLVVEPPHRLGFTWQWDGEERASVVTISLTGDHAETELAVSHEGLADETEAENHAKGWSDCLDRLPGWLSPA